MSDTHRTDAEISTCPKCGALYEARRLGCGYCEAEDIQTGVLQLERELMEARAEIVNLQRKIESLVESGWTDVKSLKAENKNFSRWHEEDTAKLIKAREEIDRLKKEANQNRCEHCNGELTYCGDQNAEGTPSLGCIVCRQKVEIAALTEKLKEARECLVEAIEQCVKLSKPIGLIQEATHRYVIERWRKAAGMDVGHKPDCAVALNARHECSCGANKNGGQKQ